MVLFLILLLVATVTGVLWSVLKIAAGVALGLFLGFALIGLFFAWLLKRSFRRMSAGTAWSRPIDQPGVRWRRVGSSRIEVLDSRDER